MTMGIIEYSEKAEYDYSTKYVSGKRSEFFQSGKIDIHSILDNIYKEAISLNGDCIMNFKINFTETTIPNTGYISHKVPGVEISGIIIKRLDGSVALNGSICL